MREALSRHFDVLVVVWSLSLVMVAMLLVLSRAPLSNDQWTSAPVGPVWVIPSATP